MCVPKGIEMNLKKTKTRFILAVAVSSVLTSTAITAAESNAMSEAPRSNIEKLDEYFKKGDYEYVVSTLEDLKEKTPKQYNMLISALMNIDLDDAEEMAEEFISVHSNDYKAFHTHANVMGAQASNSVFSALSYAKKAKTSLETAIKIASDEVGVYQALMQFHIVAPSIAGGDMEEAERLADKIAMIDAIEGKFAKAKFYLEDEQLKRASSIYAELAEQDATKVRASLELGSHYLSEENYQNAFDTLSVLLTTSVPTVEDKESALWDDYQESKSDLLYGKYRLGLVAVNSGQYTNDGIAALEQYIKEYNSTNIDTTRLPSMNWANLRLAELRLNANDIEEAKSTLALIDGEEGERFAKIMKGLKKQIKKRA
jgi:lipopolysaccharide biosynthesis regulator YciM